MGLLAVGSLVAQASTESSHANEPIVVEELSTDVTFSETGTGSVRSRARILIGNESGVQQLGQIAFPYLSGQESLSPDFARVIRTDGSIQEVAEESIQDIPAPFSAQFPVYSDFRIIHFIAPPMRPGDILEYQETREILKPPAPGRFFFEHRFQRQAVVRQETLTVAVPGSVSLSLRYNDELPPERTEREADILLSWTTSNPESQPLILDAEAENLLPLPDVEISSFATWKGVGEWYRELAAERASPTPEIKEKAKQLTQGLQTDEEKVRSIYNFVAKDFRYLALLLGTTAYQPHYANEVLTNGYGDCKDKHTLLEALLAAIGIQASPVIVSATRALSPEVPSPKQFDHVITRVELKDAREFWLDSTTQIAPFGYLLPVIRGKRGLLIPPSDEPSLVDLPDSLPFESLFDVNVEGKIDESGTLEGLVDYRVRGDEEFFVRTSLFALPPAQWTSLVEAVQESLTWSGEVSDPEFSSATDTDEPFSLRYEVRTAGYLDPESENQELEPMLPKLRIPKVPEPNEDDSYSEINLAGPYLKTGRFVVQLPNGFAAAAPVDIHL